MRRLALLPVLVLLTAGCGWQNLLLPGFVNGPGPFPPAKVYRVCVVMTPDGKQHPCRSRPRH